MKLYATVTSERASKGQGGNDSLQIDLTIEHDNQEREKMGQLYLYREKDGRVVHSESAFVLSYADNTGNKPVEIDRVLVKQQVIEA